VSFWPEKPDKDFEGGLLYLVARDFDDLSRRLADLETKSELLSHQLTERFGMINVGHLSREIHRSLERPCASHVIP
jgi:hypothetical protein